MRRLFLGIDVSTTGAKALLIDEKGGVAASATTPLTLQTPKPLWSEQDPHEWWKGTSASIRKALADQLKEIEAIAPVLTRPQIQSPAPEPYRQPQLTQRREPPLTLRDEVRGAPDFGAPQFDDRGRPVGGQQGDADLGGAAGAYGANFSGRGPSGPAEYRQPATHEGWSVGDLLTNADTPGYPPRRPDPYAPRGQQPHGAAAGLRLDEIARAIDHRTAAEVWQRFRAGERGVLGRHLYSLDGQATFDEISRRYERDGDFRATVDRYIADFERLLRDAEQSDPSVMQNYMTSETGRVYLLLAHASGRLR